MENYRNKLIMIIVTILIIGLCLLVGFDVAIPKMQDVVVAIECCDGSYCTDTYYTPEDNKCHLVLCEHNPFMDKSKCIYEGANKSIKWNKSSNS